MPVFNVNAGNNDEFKASLLPEASASFDYVYRYTHDERSRLAVCRSERPDRQWYESAESR